jgi:L-alanine-DL-glutamate epimerase-like enolase superfamily enzyme
MFPRGGAFDFSHQFVADGALELETAGRLRAPTREGIGLEIDWRSVEDHTSRRSVAQ